MTVSVVRVLPMGYLSHRGFLSSSLELEALYTVLTA